MKKSFYFLLPASSIIFVILMASFGGGELKNSNGAPAGNTNSPGDGQNCTHCMGGSAAPVTGWITSDVPSSGYFPGSTYTITVSVTGTGKKGFEVSPQDLAGNLIGTLTAGSGSKLVGSNKYVTHNAAKSGNPSTWTFQWTAPLGGAGNVTFYGSMAITQTVTKTSTLVVNQSTVGMAEEGLSILSIYPNPAQDRINVSLFLDNHGVLKLDILNMHGSPVSTLMQESCLAGNLKRSFSIRQPAGTYILHLNANGKDRFSKLMVVD